MEYKGKRAIKIDVNREYGIVLEGGGARGAYQIGAWKALREAGVKIKGVSGTSVGALNGAMICMDDFDVAEEIWSDMKYSQVMDVKDDWIESIIKGDFIKNNFRDAMKTAFMHVKDGGFDTAPLRKLIDEKLNPKRIKDSDIEFYFEVFSVENFKELSVDAKQIPDEEMTDMLLASSYLPVFKKDGDLGRKLIDGGLINNVPVDALIERGYEDIICIRIFGIGTEKKIDIPHNVNIYEIEPRIDLGGILEFDGKRSRQNMKAGYYDALRFMYGLGGRIYYLDEDCHEYECLCELGKLSHAMWKFNEENAKPVVKGITEPEIISYREIFEEILPDTASDLRIGRDWDYKEIYLAMLEATAKFLKVPKYCIYTLKEFKEQIIKKWRDFEEEADEMPNFVRHTVALCMF